MRLSTRWSALALLLYPATSLEQRLVWQTVLAVALWLAVAVVMLRFVHREAPPASPMPAGIGWH